MSDTPSPKVEAAQHATKRPTNADFLDAMTAKLWRADKKFTDVDDSSAGRKSIISVENTKGEFEDAEVQGINKDILPIMMLRSVLDQVHDGNTPYEGKVKPSDMFRMIQLVSTLLKGLAKPDKIAEGEKASEDAPANGQAVNYTTDKSGTPKGQLSYRTAEKVLGGLVAYATEEFGFNEDIIKKAQTTKYREELTISPRSALPGFGGIQPDHADWVLDKVSAEREL
jgi:hypothetical protein